jgi:hypothetical protein
MNWQLTLSIIITATLVGIALIAASLVGTFIFKRWGAPAEALWTVYTIVVIIAVLLGALT